MITFSIAILLLVAGYFLYGGFVNRIFAPDVKAATPAMTMADGVDYIPMPTWRIFMIQFLNIAGLGPIFGAIMGAQFGTASYLWIVLGTIFAGAVHDFFAGGLSLREKGESLPELIARYLGSKTKMVVVVLTMVLMVLVGAVFVSGPAELLGQMVPGVGSWLPSDWGLQEAVADALVWVVVIFAYYVLATLLPVDKIIGKIYPLFAFALLFMGVGILVMMYVNRPELPEMWESFGTKYETSPIFPMMFISIACGAISGFHATQSPMMARCMKNEKHARPVFYGAMVTEGIIALIWAAAATYFFHENGTTDAAGNAYSGAAVATSISKQWLGTIGGVLAILGIVAAPITSGDTALRSARLIMADILHLGQKPMRNRLMICIPIFIITIAVLAYSYMDSNGFKIIWRYFAWCNQTLSVFTLWAISVWMVRRGKPWLVAVVPALFMTVSCATYICIAPEGFGMSEKFTLVIAPAVLLVSAISFALWFRKERTVKRYNL